MAKTSKLGEKTTLGGGADTRKPRVARAGKAKANIDGKPLPPAPKPERGVKVIASKSGRYIIASPAKSATTVESWSNAFKKTN